MKTIKDLIGVCLIILGIAAGIYVGFVWSFVGGIMGIIELVKGTETLTAMNLAVDVAKIVLATPLGFLTFIIFAIFGKAFLEADKII